MTGFDNAISLMSGDNKPQGKVKIKRYDEPTVIYSDIADNMLEYKNMAEPENKPQFNGEVYVMPSSKGLYENLFNQYKFIFVDTPAHEHKNDIARAPYYADCYPGITPVYPIVESGYSERFNSICGYCDYSHESECRYDDLTSKMFFYNFPNNAVVIVLDLGYAPLRKLQNLINIMGNRRCCMLTSNGDPSIRSIPCDVFAILPNTEGITDKPNQCIRTAKGTSAETVLGPAEYSSEDYIIKYDSDVERTVFRYKGSSSTNLIQTPVNLKSAKYSFKGIYKGLKFKTDSLDVTDMFYVSSLKRWLDGVIVSNENGIITVDCPMPSNKDIFDKYSKKIPNWGMYTASSGNQPVESPYQKGRTILEIDLTEYATKVSLSADEIKNIIRNAVNSYKEKGGSFSCQTYLVNTHYEDYKCVAVYDWTDTGD